MRKFTLAILLVAFLLPTTSPAQEVAGGVWVNKGEVVPADGVLFSERSVVILTNALRELMVSREKIVALEGQVSAMERESAEKDKAVAELQEAKRQLQFAVEKLEFINSNHKLIEDALRAAVEIYKQALVDAREDNRALRSELFWTKVLGIIPIIGAIAVAVAGM